MNSEVNFVATGRVIAVDPYGGAGQLSEIPWTPGMIKDDFLVKFFQL